MEARTTVEAQVDTALQAQAIRIYEAAGLTMNEVLRRLLLRTVEQQSVPLDLSSPSAETLKAMEELHSGNAAQFDSVSELMADLNADG